MHDQARKDRDFVQVLNSVSGSLPFLPADDTVPREETRLRHRTLDLRQWPIPFLSCTSPHFLAAGHLKMPAVL